MLKFILGRSGYGKTSKIIDQIENRIKSGEKNIALMCPEQFSFNAERILLKELGERDFSQLQLITISRLSNDAKRSFKTSSLPVLSQGGKAILMKQAIDKSADELILFGKKIDSTTFVSSMIRIYDEMKSCNVSDAEIMDACNKVNKDLLSKKLHDISIIMKNYDESIANNFLDPADELTRLYETLLGQGYFCEKTIYIDGFNGFVAQEYKILEIMIAEAKEVIISLDTDGKDNELFDYVNNTVGILSSIAKKCDCNVEYEYLQENKRTSKGDLKHLEKYIFTDDEPKYNGKCDNIEIYLSKSITDECAAVSRKIKELLRQGMRAREIAVITRDLNKYSPYLISAFKKYEVPFFVDERQPIKNQPIIVFCEYLLRVVNFSFRSDDILSLAKTGLTSLNNSQISKLENYTFIWSINGLKWKNEFTNSPKGFSPNITDNDIKELKEINSARETLIKPLVAFARNVKAQGAKTVCEAMYKTLIAFKANDALTSFANDLMNSGKSVLAIEQGTSWDTLMNILSQMAITLGDNQISLKEFASLFSLMVSSEDLGSIPAGLDNVQLGQADRMRTDNPKAVFVIGANEGEFPQSVSTGGILTDNERKLLTENDFKLYSYGEIITLQERYFAYKACCAASEKLFVTYFGNTSKESSPSAIITGIISMFDDVKISYYNGLDDLSLIESKSSAFELMADRFEVNTEFYSSLKEYFKDDSRTDAIRKIANNEQYKIHNKLTAKRLFKNDICVSASRIEDYYNCHFRYFCKFGLNARAVNKAEINPMQRGTLIHYVLEHILSDVGSKNLSVMSFDEIKILVNKYMKIYFENEMGNLSDITERFKYNYNRLSKAIISVVVRLANEFKNSDFEAKAFELNIDVDGTVKSQVLTLEDGSTICVRGSIDRVDTLIKDGKQYVRVVDYKSGTKDFALSDVINGLNLQMFVYLFNLCNDKSCELSGVPAGVLYLHSSRDVISVDDRSNCKSSITSNENKSFKAKGIILDDEGNHIAENMDHMLDEDKSKSIFIPVEKKNGSISGSLASYEELGLLNNKINELIIQMGNDLHNGMIEQNPVKNKNHDKTCDFCDYRSVCLLKKNIENRICDDISDSEVKDLLKGDEDNA